jgi:hypothetical protein
LFLGTSADDVYRNRFRVKRFARFLGIVDDIIARKGQCLILDSGGRMEHWSAMADLYGDRDIRVTLVNLEAEETTDPRFTSVAGNACAMPEFADNSFDLVYSNSVIEHVGRWSDQKRMAAEVRRLAPHHFIQTPDYWCPIEPHFRMPRLRLLPARQQYRRGADDPRGRAAGEPAGDEGAVPGFDHRARAGARPAEIPDRRALRHRPNRHPGQGREAAAEPGPIGRESLGMARLSPWRTSILHKTSLGPGRAAQWVPALPRKLGRPG